LIFTDLSKIVNDTIIDKVDHKVLNEVFDFRTTSENLASYFYLSSQSRFTSYDIKLEKVVLWESESARVEIMAPFSARKGGA